MKKVTRAWQIVVMVLTLSTAANMAGQRSGTSGGTNEPITPPSTSVPGTLPPLDQPAGAPDGGLDAGMRARMEQMRLKAVNTDRQKRLVADVDKLVQLTSELKTEVDKTTKDELSVDVIKKAQEIEKLAHDVQSRMKN